VLAVGVFPDAKVVTAMGFDTAPHDYQLSAIHDVSREPQLRYATTTRSVSYPRASDDKNNTKCLSAFLLVSCESPYMATTYLIR